MRTCGRKSNAAGPTPRVVTFVACPVSCLGKVMRITASFDTRRSPREPMAISDWDSTSAACTCRSVVRLP